MKFSSIEGLTFLVLHIQFLRAKLLETKLKSNEETREENYEETELESNEVIRDPSYRETKLERKGKSYGGKKLENNEKKTN